MQIIPVIDLLNGVAVHARHGDRKHYQVIQSQLTKSKQPIDVVQALLDYYPFQNLYIADLDAIQKLNGPDSSNYSVIEAITQRFPTLNIWVDAGIGKREELTKWQQLGCHLILGSESFASLNAYRSLIATLNNSSVSGQDYALSLDFMPQGYHGPIELSTNSHYWPKDVILMTLANVGSNLGVNMVIPDVYKKYAATHKLYVAGGIRDAHDLTLLKQAGFHGALIATALHQKQITSTQLDELIK
ncbi:MAG: nickel transporter [Betaproteobacteria bacterium]|nr:nickel transporter [Betaproteobacteria bacterium]